MWWSGVWWSGVWWSMAYLIHGRICHILEAIPKRPIFKDYDIALRIFAIFTIYAVRKLVSYAMLVLLYLQ